MFCAWTGSTGIKEKEEEENEEEEKEEEEKEVLGKEINRKGGGRDGGKTRSLRLPVILTNKELQTS